MHRILGALVGVFAVAGLGLGYITSNAAGVQQAPDPVTVIVDVRCPGEKVDISVDPWTADMTQGDELEWVLATGADATELTITNKRGAGGWPFSDAPPYRGGRTDRPRGRNMKPNQGGKRYRYNIELTCQSETGGPFEVVIDPDMIIKR